jgi:hypothetical protein
MGTQAQKQSLEMPAKGGSMIIRGTTLILAGTVLYANFAFG